MAVQACDHEITRYFKAYLIQTRSTDGNKLYINFLLFLPMAITTAWAEQEKTILKRSGYRSGSQTQLLWLLVRSVVYAPPTGTYTISVAGCRSNRSLLRSVGPQILSIYGWTLLTSCCRLWAAGEGWGLAG